MTPPGNQPELITADLRSAVAEAIRRTRTEIRWKSGKDVKHLAKRIRLGHLPAEATLTEYEAIITTILNDDRARLYVFFYDDTSYPTVVATFGNREWLVIIDLNGVMETAFPPDDPTNYLADSAFVYVGLVEI